MLWMLRFLANAKGRSMRPEGARWCDCGVGRCFQTEHFEYEAKGKTAMKLGSKYILTLAAAAVLGHGALDAEAKPRGEIIETLPGSSTVVVINSEQSLQDDIEISSLVFYQELRLLEAGQAIEECIYGRSTFDAARKTVERCRQQGERLNSELLKYQSQHSSSLGRVAVQLWEKRREILDKMEKLLQSGKIDRPALRAFQEQNGELTQDVVVKWLGAKDRWAVAGLQQPSAMAQQYYDWQIVAIPAQKTMCIQSQRLLELSAALANGKKLSGNEAKEIQNSLASLKNDLSRYKPAKFIQEAHRALISEVTALGRLAEAIDLLNQDRSSDASDRVERCNKQLRRAALRSGQTSLEALRACRAKK